MGKIRSVAGKLPGARYAARALHRMRFRGSQTYWEDRYVAGGSSGEGSYGQLATYKAQVLNEFVQSENIHRVLEFGCGDGNQLTLAKYPQYVGLDVSPTALKRCLALFKDDRTKSFFLYEPRLFSDRLGLFMADLTMSLDVIYHLVEDEVFELHMRHLFASAERFVVIYSSDLESPGDAPHVRHRKFSRWVADNQPGWRLLKKIQGPPPSNDGELSPSHSEFFIYEKVSH